MEMIPVEESPVNDLLPGRRTPRRRRTRTRSTIVLTPQSNARSNLSLAPTPDVPEDTSEESEPGESTAVASESLMELKTKGLKITLIDDVLSQTQVRWIAVYLCADLNKE